MWPLLPSPSSLHASSLCLRILQEIYSFLAQELKSLASAHGERLLHTPHNPISLGKLSVLAPNCFVHVFCLFLRGLNDENFISDLFISTFPSLLIFMSSFCLFVLRVASFSCSHVSGWSPGRERQGGDSPWLHVVHPAGVRSQVWKLSKGVAAIWPRIGNMGRKGKKQEGVEVSVYWGVSAHHDSQKWVCPRPPKLMGMSCVLPNKMSSWNQQSARWICWIWCSWGYFSWLDCPSRQGPPPDLIGWFPLWSAERRLHTRWRSIDSHVLARSAGVFSQRQRGGFVNSSLLPSVSVTRGCQNTEFQVGGCFCFSLFPSNSFWPSMGAHVNILNILDEWFIRVILSCLFCVWVSNALVAQ